MCQSYQPELDSSHEHEEEDIIYYQELMGILRLSIEIGRIDIGIIVSMLSDYQASPRHGHLLALYQIFANLKKKLNYLSILIPNYQTLVILLFRIMLIILKSTTEIL